MQHLGQCGRFDLRLERGIRRSRRRRARRRAPSTPQQPERRPEPSAVPPPARFDEWPLGCGACVRQSRRRARRPAAPCEPFAACRRVNRRLPPGWPSCKRQGTLGAARLQFTTVARLDACFANRASSRRREARPSCSNRGCRTVRRRPSSRSSHSDGFFPQPFSSGLSR
jgi:hypothetical protein